MQQAEQVKDRGPVTPADLAKALRHFGNENDKFDWLGQEAAIMLEQQAAKIETLVDALKWIREMAGYAADHLDPDWKRSNGYEFSSALDQASSALSE